MIRFMTLCAVLFAFILTSPVALAAPPEGDAVEEKADAKAPEEAKEEAKADEKAPEEAKADGDGDAKEEAPEEAKADEKAADEPSTEDMVEKAKEVVAAARGGEWALMISGIIMLVLAAVRKFKVLDKVPNNALPWISVVLGVLAVVGDNLATGGEITTQRLLEGVMAGLAASGGWALIGKHLPVLGTKKS